MGISLLVGHVGESRPQGGLSQRSCLNEWGLETKTHKEGNEEGTRPYFLLAVFLADFFAPAFFAGAVFLATVLTVALAEVFGAAATAMGLPQSFADPLSMPEPAAAVAAAAAASFFFLPQIKNLMCKSSKSRPMASSMPARKRM